LNSLYFKTTKEWRAWLGENHDKEAELWLIFYKKETGKPTLEYEAAVEEALCFGWVDSIIKKIDEQQFARKFTPRKDDSKWSPLNKSRVERLIKSGRMTKIGLAKIETAKANGMWDQPDRPEISFDLPEDFQLALEENQQAGIFFKQLAPSYKKQYIGWIQVAKRAETRAKRIKESIELLAKGEKLGMK